MNNDPMSNQSVDSQALLNQIVLDYMKEKKSRKRWRWIKRAILVLILAVIVYQVMDSNKEDSGGNTKPHVGVVDLDGEISDLKTNADDFVKGVSAAYKNKGLKALVVRINSPGGSPVQAEYMYNTLKHYKKKHPKVKTYAVCVDLCASAAYYVAVAADEIYASPASMVGSIGVLYNGFGFVDLINKLGVSRRLQTSGVNKGFMDPFSPETDEQKAKLQVMLDIVHQQFINRVKEGRGERLHIDDDTFSGLFWTGEQAMGMGLIDGFASTGQLARDTIKEEHLVDYTSKQNLLDKVTKGIGSAFADSVPESLGLKPGFK
jgi:protease-4